MLSIRCKTSIFGHLLVDRNSVQLPPLHLACWAVFAVQYLHFWRLWCLKGQFKFRQPVACLVTHAVSTRISLRSKMFESMFHYLCRTAALKQLFSILEPRLRWDFDVFPLRLWIFQFWTEKYHSTRDERHLVAERCYLFLQFGIRSRCALISVWFWWNFAVWSPILVNQMPNRGSIFFRNFWHWVIRILGFSTNAFAKSFRHASITVISCVCKLFVDLELNLSAVSEELRRNYRRDDDLIFWLLCPPLLLKTNNFILVVLNKLRKSSLKFGKARNIPMEHISRNFCDRMLLFQRQNF